MSTRGAVIHTINGKDIIFYSRSDSYPSYLGLKLIHFIQSLVGTPGMKQLAWVEDGDARIQEFKDALLATELAAEEDKYEGEDAENLQNAAHDPSVFLPPISLRKRHETDENWLADSLFCEWAWRIDWDTKELEIFVGFQGRQKVDFDREGRYARLYGGTSRWYPVKSLGKISFYANMEEEMYRMTVGR